MHPIAFEVGSITVYWYGVLVGLGCLTGLWTASRRALLDRVAPDRVFDVAWWVLLGAILGARGLYVATYWNDTFAGKPLINVLNIRQGGLVFYGGFLGAAVAVIAYAWRYSEPLWRLADLLTPSIALGSFFGRIGCLMTGCCYGRACTLPWAIEFPVGHATHGIRVHPTQVYDSLLNLTVYGLLEWAYRRKRFDGQVFSTWLMVYPITRSFTELFRGDYPEGQINAGLTPAQLLSIGVFVAGLLLHWKLPRTLAGRGPTPQSPAGDA